MKYMSGAEAISIFKPTDPSLTLLVGVKPGQQLTQRNWAGFFFFLSLCILISLWTHPPWLRLGRRRKDASLVMKTKIRFMTAANKAEHQHPPTSADILVLDLKSPFTVPRKKVCHRSVGKLEREYKWFTGSLTPRGPRLLCGRSRRLAQYAVLFVPVGSGAPSVGTSHSSCRYWLLQQDCNNL